MQKFKRLITTIKPIERHGESIVNKKSRLIYQSRKRGIVETDLLLSTFANEYLSSMTPDELQEYDKLLDEPDWDIYYWAIKSNAREIPQQWKNSKILQSLQKHAENKARKLRIMPEL